MDAAKSNRLYPSYTLAQIKAFAAIELDADKLAKMNGEIARREAGVSVALVVPQLGGGRSTPRLGRM